MKRLYYSLHNHSCLSPCADNDNTPNNLLGMAALSGIGIMALTDHNTVKNCPAFFEAAKNYGVIPIAGMELTTSEDIHVVFLFPTLESAMRFGDYVESQRILIRNRPDIFGEQLITDAMDNVIGRDEHLLSNATSISVEDVIGLAREYGGVCFPAHIDKDANSITAILGTIPEHLDFRSVEVHDQSRVEKVKELYPIDGKTVLIDTDSHYLTDIEDALYYVDVDTEESDADILRNLFIDLLR
ncbi:MAG: PHP domain-containing protein [Clostridia bacterium]|nr:PHP domain-containing protein [Clostridia bacterium]